ncbi:hypothetical protein MTsPCn9_08580 [Croceitalea sp. MTPC9]|nr:hypothetical protein MTsPCn6_00130 [Croceitalea sp. MTPC6]GMN15922.1 hypothetical protein MTsPCn9_08580 [Croceitalea sp. MTPC9]
MEPKENSEEPNSFIWKKEYSLVLILNTLYILLFHFLMKVNI